MQKNRIPVFCILIGNLFLLLSCSSLTGVMDNRQQPAVENVEFTQEEHTVIISYDLLADSEDSVFDVQLLLIPEEGRGIVLNSSSVSGDVGEGVEAGRQNKIVWDVLQDIPQGVESDQIQFAVNVQRQQRTNRQWIYIASGALVLGAGLSVAGILLRDGGGESAGLPLPPSRPEN